MTPESRSHAHRAFDPKRLSEAGDVLAFGGGAVWVAAKPGVVRIDPARLS